MKVKLVGAENSASGRLLLAVKEVTDNTEDDSIHIVRIPITVTKVLTKEMVIEEIRAGIEKLETADRRVAILHELEGVELDLDN